MSHVIEVNNISKLYRLGAVGSKTLHDDIISWWNALTGKENPYSKLGEANDRTKKGSSNYVWALQDINFGVQQGDVLGIIGRNGAGKSTLLKILSKITAPTKGEIRIKGRVASLLEVGTGFHPELSGKDNIYLNGAILGMSKKEIRAKFDDIVEFSGVERYIDTPVKRYSSGMYVRLAFAVAAHLEPDILIVDEVLAVGDAEFQKKCLGKMKEVSEQQGRTVLFVSHNMSAIMRLCNKAIILNKGRLEFNGTAAAGVSAYMKGDVGTVTQRVWEDNAPGNSFFKLRGASCISTEENEAGVLDIRRPVCVKMTYEVLQDDIYYTHGFNLYKDDVHVLSSHDTEFSKQKIKSKKGIYEVMLQLPANFLSEGFHTIGLAIMSYNPFIIHFHEQHALDFIIADTADGGSARGEYGGNYPGVIRPMLNWQQPQRL